MQLIQFKSGKIIHHVNPLNIGVNKMTLKQYKQAYLKHAEEENCLPCSDFTLTKEEMVIVENAKTIWSVQNEHSNYDGMIKILDKDNKVLWSHINAWHDDYCPYIVNAICATKKEASGKWTELVVNGIEGSAEFYL